MMSDMIQVIITIFASVMASSGFWAWFSKKSEKNDSTHQMLMGIAHYKIVERADGYIQRGYITKDEYDNFIRYLWTPYQAFGGNGLAEKLKKHVDELPIRKDDDR